jgi:hypothetical protein
VEFEDPTAGQDDAQLVRRAFQSLPLNYQTVLWHAEINGEKPAKIAPYLGKTANTVSKTLERARGSLRRAFLDVVVADAIARDLPAGCRQARTQLRPYVLGSLSRAERAAVDAHLDTCDACREVAAQVADAGRAMRAGVLPALIGGGAA